MHIMQMIDRRDGVEEWLCFLCFRHLLITWTPFSISVVTEGDATAKHSGGIKISVEVR